MKAKMLKLAGVKSEKEFYKKFPTEKAFMDKHGKAFKKAQIGAYIGGEKGAGFQPISYKDVYDQTDYAITGFTEDQRREEAYRQAEIAAAQKAAEGGGGGGGIGGMLQQLPQMLGEGGGGEGMAALAGARKGRKLTKLQAGSSSGLISIPNPTQMAQADATINQQFAAENAGPQLEEIPGGDISKTIGKYAGPAGQIVQGIQQLKEEKRALERAEQMRDVSGVVKQAASTRPEETKRRYVRPEDIVNTGEEFFPIYGVGTNVLARNGASVGGGEIMNTFAPNTLYDDLGYEPMNDSERYKQYLHGGRMHKAQDGFLSSFAGAGGGGATSQLITGITGENAGGNLGGTIGGTIGSAFGPAGQMIGQIGGQLIGTALDRRPQQIKKAKGATQRNIQATAMQQGMQGGQSQYTSFMKDGGMTTSPYEWVSHTWQPQTITKFGEHNLKDLLRAPKDADMLRAGGHLKEYTAPSARAMSTERPMMQNGGDLQVHWGGYAEPMSYNPYLPEGGETVMFKGQSHDESDGRGNTGIGITYGENPVEVERGEPAMKMKDGGSPNDSSFLVFGNLKIPKGMLGADADGKNFKRYVSEISEQENKQNKLMDKSVTALRGIDVKTPFERLKFNSLQANVMGANMKFKDYAEKKMNAAALQTAMNDTIEEYGMKTTDKGDVMAKLGASIQKAQDGIKKLSKVEALAEVPKGQRKGKVYYGGVDEEAVMRMKKENPWYDWSKFNPSKKGDVEAFQKDFNKTAKELGESVRLREDDRLGQQTVSAKGLYETKQLPGVTVTGKRKSTPPQEKPPQEEAEITPYKRSTLMDIMNQIVPYLRPTDEEELDEQQLAGEMFALATNQLEPVQAQTFQPQLSVPYDISLQDILNENQATFRSQQRMFGYNPALQSQVNAQKYMSNQRVLGEQFRLNQAMKDQVYKENRNILNQSQLQNLGILDQQYARQSEAKSKTKATTQAALNSIASKYAQNQLENRTLQTYENMYNYRFDPRFRAMNMNPLWQPNIDGQQTASNTGRTAGVSEIGGQNKVKQGRKVSKKNLNGSIVRALKNI